MASAPQKMLTSIGAKNVTGSSNMAFMDIFVVVFKDHVSVAFVTFHTLTLK